MWIYLSSEWSRSLFTLMRLQGLIYYLSNLESPLSVHLKSSPFYSAPTLILTLHMEVQWSYSWILIPSLFLRPCWANYKLCWHYSGVIQSLMWLVWLVHDIQRGGDGGFFGSFHYLLSIFITVASLAAHNPALCGLHSALLAQSSSTGLPQAIQPFGSKNSSFRSFLAHLNQADHWLGPQTPSAYPNNTNTPNPHIYIYFFR